jgi:transcription termination factor NusB
MDAKEILELLILSTEKFGMLYTLVVFVLIGLFAYLMKNKAKTEKVLTATLEEMNKANSESVRMTAENIKEIKKMTMDVLENTNQLNGEIRGIVDIIKFLMIDYRKRTREGEDDEGGDK